MLGLSKKLAAWGATAAVLVCAGVHAQEVEVGSEIRLFDGETTFGWVPVGAASWTVEGGALKATTVAGGGAALFTSTQFTDFQLDVKIRVSRSGTAGIVVRSPYDGFTGANGAGVVMVGGREGETQWEQVRITAKGGDMQATINDKVVEGFSASNKIGHIGILYHHYHGQKSSATVEVSDVTLKPLSLKPIFNGTDLTGWNIIPDKASKFSVDEGAIHILDGNGQIETAGVYKNFLVQMDILSNGEHLNSGVFFRGPVGVFWKGYESQVRNEWEGYEKDIKGDALPEDRTKPRDFGTGAIYGVQPARKVVSNDKEWFQKTIVANENHFATWINGYQVSDFLDTRPASDNGDGKAGYVDQAGTIHLQGHDPTTDLSFKNINLQQYPE